MTPSPTQAQAQAQVQTQVLEYTLGAREEQASFPLDIGAGAGAWEGWVWYRARPTWFDPTPVPSLHSLAPYTIHLVLVHDGAESMCIYPVSSRTGVVCLQRGEGTPLGVRVRRVGGAGQDTTDTGGRADTDGQGADTNVDTNARRADTDADTNADTHGRGADTNADTNADTHGRGADTNADTHGRGAVVITRGASDDGPSLVAAAVASARAWLFGADAPFPPLARGPLDGLGCCTWSALGENVHPTERNLSELVDAYVAAGVPVQTFIIDDGWQNQRRFEGDDMGDGKGKWMRRGLWDFGAHPDLGAGGLAGAVAMVRDKFAAVPGAGGTEVGVWLTLTGGYWDGIHPESPLVRRYACRPYRTTRGWWPGVPNEPGTVAYMPRGEDVYYLPPPETAGTFWRDYFSAMRAAGATFVKVDNQATLTGLDGADGAALALTLWTTMVSAADDVFGPARVIHCMAHHEGTFGGPHVLGLLTDGARYVWRNSDDFGMEGKPDAHQQHIFTNLLNALVATHTACVPDADMWMTAAQHPAPHGLLRALFPGPMLLADKPGQHSARVLARVIARDPTGIARVLKTTAAAAPLATRLFDTSVLDPADGTGLWAAVPTDTGAIVAVWNVRGNRHQQATVHDALTHTDVAAAVRAGGNADTHSDWVVLRADLEGCMAAAAVVHPNEEFMAPVDLAYLGVAAFWLAPLVPLAPLTPLTPPATGPRVAVLGLVDKYAGAVAVAASKILHDGLHVMVKYAGVLGIAVAGPAPRASATVDGVQSPVHVRRMPDLGNGGGVYLIEVAVGGMGEGDGWDVHVALA